MAVIGVGLIHQKKVEAAWYKMTSLIGRILGIEKGTDEYVKAIQKTIEKMGLRFLWRRLLRMKKVSGLHIL